MGFVVEELKLMTISYIALMMNFHIFVVVDEYYNNINSKKASAGENRCFSKWPLNRCVGWVVVIEKDPEPADAKTEIQRGLLHVTISYSLSPALTVYKKHKGYDISSLNKSAWMRTPAIWGTRLVASGLQRAPGCYIVTIYLQNQFL